ncbi:chloride channel protein CLC-f [Mercurialis annua]|uniref:chloride channel protein CLC-f n=1 Tax=Mercurialis annua TaxID=3986 RepID=UPI0021609150|nr:chloride channel protein CLC-f [Mercurialis annua]
MKGGEFSDDSQLLRSTDDVNENHHNIVIDDDINDDRPHDDVLDGQLVTVASPGGHRRNIIKDVFLKHLDRGFSGRRLNSPSYNNKRSSPRTYHNNHSNRRDDEDEDVLGDSAPPEWVLLLLGCLLGLASGLCVAVFNKGVHVIHDWAWAGTPNEGAAWLRLQKLGDTWHRILLIPVTGGVIVGMMHGLVEILDQIRQSSSSPRQGVDLVAGVFPAIKAIQAAITLGTGCSLGPEGPSVDIGKSCANGLLLMMENNREREITLVAAGAAAGIASGFNAAVAGCFFAIETVLRPRRAENSPPFTTAMIILASVISSTVSNVLLGTQSAFTVPPYDLKSAAELPLYLILGMLCGVVSVAFSRLVTWFTKLFEFIKERFGLPPVVCPALGGLGAGIIALRYPGILYWGFTNVEEILRTGKSASAPGIWLLAQLAVAKVVATALCKGSGLVGGLYAPSLMIGAAIGAVFGGSAAEIINSAIPGNAAVAQPQAYALVGMAATLASVCSVPLTSVLLLFELTKDYRIILPLMGAVGLAIWVPSVTNQPKETEVSDSRTLTRGYSSLSNSEDKNESWRRIDDGDDLELSVIGNASEHEAINEDLVLEDLKVSRAMSKNYVKVVGASTVKEAVDCMHNSKQNCVLVVDDEDLLEGILTYGDIRRISKKSDETNIGDSAIKDVNTCLVSAVCTRGISYRGQSRGLLTCYPDTDLATSKELMEAKGIKQLPVVKHSRGSWKERKRRLVAILHYDSIHSCLREEISRRKSIYRKESKMVESSH